MFHSHVIFFFCFNLF